MWAIESIVITAIVFTQIKVFWEARRKVEEFKNILPSYELGKEDIRKEIIGSSEVETIVENKDLFGEEFKRIVSTINKYLIKNKGSVDFNIIENIVKRSIDSKEHSISASISLPLYIGLMGTFLGIIIGLLAIAFSKDGVTDSSVNFFIGGVVTAMCASLLGLFLTFWNNYSFKDAKQQTDDNRNVFFNFLQVELLPYLGNSLFDALERLKININGFNSKFSNSLNMFDQTFTNNISTLKNTVSSLNENVSSLVENTRVQREFLLELKTIGYTRMAEANVRVFQLMKDAGPNFVKFIEKQKELNVSMEKSVEMVLSIESIMDRVKRFEESINNLGDRINNSESLSSELLVRVDKKLDHLDKQFELLEQHSKTTALDISNFFDKELDSIHGLTEKIRRALEDSLDFNTENNPLKKLHLLDSVNEHLKEIIGRLEQNQDFRGWPEKLDNSIKELMTLKGTLVSGKPLRTKPNSSPNKSQPRVRTSFFKLWTNGMLRLFTRKNGR